MDERQFDTMSRLLGRRESRRSVLAALTGAFAAVVTLDDDLARSAVAAQESNRASGDVIEQFYLAVATYQYEAAYELLGVDMQANQPVDEFVAGYADTAYAQVGIDGARTSGDHEDVQVTITAWHNDGSIHRFSGAYAVGEEGGQARILAATIREDAPPEDVPPLCRVDDVQAAFGPWEAGAGSRFSTLLVTNVSDGVRVAAGVPHLQVYDAAGTLVIESRTEQTEPFRAAPIRPGDQAAARFRWANWCEAEPAYPLTISVALPGDRDRLTLPMETTRGPVQMPPCLGFGEPATFGVRAFEAYEDPRDH